MANALCFHAFIRTHFQDDLFKLKQSLRVQKFMAVARSSTRRSRPQTILLTIAGRQMRYLRLKISASVKEPEPSFLEHLPQDQDIRSPLIDDCLFLNINQWVVFQAKLREPARKMIRTCSPSSSYMKKKWLSSLGSSVYSKSTKDLADTTCITARRASMKRNHGWDCNKNLLGICSWRNIRTS